MARDYQYLREGLRDTPLWIGSFYVNLERICSLSPIQARIELTITDGRSYEGFYSKYEITPALKTDREISTEELQRRLFRMEQAQTAVFLNAIANGIRPIAKMQSHQDSNYFIDYSGMKLSPQEIKAFEECEPDIEILINSERTSKESQMYSHLLLCSLEGSQGFIPTKNPHVEDSFAYQQPKSHQPFRERLYENDIERVEESVMDWLLGRPGRRHHDELVQRKRDKRYELMDQIDLSVDGLDEDLPESRSKDVERRIELGRKFRG
jgi:hypothetical protein